MNFSIMMPALLLASTSVMATPFDGQLQGLQVGVAAGLSHGEFAIDDDQGVTQYGSGLGTGGHLKMRVGAGLNENWSLYLQGTALAWQPSSDVLSTIYLVGPAVSLYLPGLLPKRFESSDAPRLFVTSSLSYALNQITSERALSFVESSGSAWSLGVGVEFSSHWNVEAEYVASHFYTLRSGGKGAALDYDVGNINVSIAYLFY